MDYYSLQGCKKIGNKVSFWVFPGSRSGVSFSLFPRTVFLAIGVILAALIFSAAVLVHQTIYWYSHDEQESVRLLRTYLQRRTAAAAQDTVKQVEKLDDSELDAKIQLLVDEFVRVRGYENRLRSKASALDAILQDTLQLNRDRTGSSLTGDQATHSPARDGGIGGGDIPLAPVRGLYPKIAKRVFKENPEDLLDWLDFQTDKLSRIPIGIPVPEGRLTSRFGKRRSPFTRRWQMHQGIDFAAALGTRVVSTAQGEVIFAGRKRGLGRVVKIDHGNGVETAYGHLSRIAVRVGQKVCRDQLIGFVGNSGRSTGPHLHYEVRVAGVARDPQPFIELASTIKYLRS